MTFSNFVRVTKFVVKRQQHVIDDQEAVAGVVRDIGDIVGMQAQVQRVQHAAGAGHREVRLEVRVVVPHQRRHALAALQAQLLQCAAERERAAVEIGVAIAMQAAVGQARDDFRLREQLPRAREDVRERQRKLHHCRLHIIINRQGRQERQEKRIIQK